ncbi:biotin-dependent carboxyltransferase family protein [Pelistega europaea]|uniref:Biotin-dependent carboxyltransferase family protein n=1 Tax=Pelistega europaea TaxID=106147 RepID=A0A7Y4L8Y0_9BURK|nr:biotin-dependent carboxyltransferase family protein [Pelistega europaea]NOL49174.1 biotin-dependent carboxyltransferase family protein [Pelistega europaea]
MSITVIKPGMLTTIQDSGRWGYQQLGVPVTGAMDSNALRLANILVGNPCILPSLEITLTGPTLRFESNACIAICGAFLSPYIDDEPIHNNRAYIITTGQTLSFKASPNNSGARAYLAIHAGLNTPPVLGSTSTDLQSHLGGIKGQALKKDDTIPFNGRFRSRHLLTLKQHLQSQRIYLSSGLGIRPKNHLRVTKGTHFSLFNPTTQHMFLDTEYKISHQSNRMGYRLQGVSLSLEKPQQILSEPTAFGTIQVPPDGLPIILMADRQSTGGYPKIANVISADLGYLAQLLPGQTLNFSLISLEEAQHIQAKRTNHFQELQQQLHDTINLLKTNFVYF